MGIVSEQEFISRVSQMNRFSFAAGERDDVSKLDTHDLRYVEDGRFCANLHVHTENSDGTMTVEEVLKNARILSDKNPNFLVAITDHDTVEGDKEAVELIKKYEDVSRIWLFSGVQRKEAHKLYNKLGYDDLYPFVNKKAN